MIKHSLESSKPESVWLTFIALLVQIRKSIWWIYNSTLYCVKFFTLPKSIDCLSDTFFYFIKAPVVTIFFLKNIDDPNFIHISYVIFERLETIFSDNKNFRNFSPFVPFRFNIFDTPLPFKVTNCQKNLLFCRKKVP